MIDTLVELVSTLSVGVSLAVFAHHVTSALQQTVGQVVILSVAVITVVAMMSLIRGYI
jgi:hypothetical protein